MSSPTDRPSSPQPMTKILNPAPSRDQRVDLRRLGFKGYVSESALREMQENDVRAQRVVTTAARFAFR
jgi:hypothetical protein